MFLMFARVSLHSRPFFDHKHKGSTLMNLCFATGLRLLAVWAVLFHPSCGRPPGEVPEQPTEDVESNGSGNRPSPLPIANNPVVFPTQLTCPNGTDLTYENFGRGFIRMHCLSCHSREVLTTRRAGAPDNVQLNTYDDVQTWRSRIVQRVVVDQTMPPAAIVTQGQLQSLTEWLGCGAP